MADTDIRSDLERFWAFYQEDVLKEVYTHILEKTGNRPSFDQQPYFKRLSVELWLSEPDYRLGLDEEVVSSLEALHDELYFDTLDFLRGITEIDPAEGDMIPEDSSRYSAPGNILPIFHPSLEGEAAAAQAEGAGARSVPTDEIISPEMCLEIVRRLSSNPGIKSYIAGSFYEGRDIPVLEIFAPLGPYTSLPRLVTAKPTLYMSGRQHANEVSSTNYILRFAELLAQDPEYRSYATKVNFVLHPLENPDGAALAYELQKLTPFHSLHAGRYSSLGMDIGSQTGAARPLLPEAKVRGKLNRKWLPDIYLNLHGYPSHEWVQPFSGYAPYLFRDYWIPRGWFAYFRALSLPLYPDLAEAGQDLQGFIIRGMQARPDIHESNRSFYDRYYRWAARWQPHMNYLERYGGVNLYTKRRSSREERLSERRRITFAEETPELMDETAQGEWLVFLVEQRPGPSA